VLPGVHAEDNRVTQHQLLDEPEPGLLALAVGELQGVGAPDNSTTAPEPVLSNEALGSVNSRPAPTEKFLDPTEFTRAFLRNQR